MFTILLKLCCAVYYVSLVYFDNSLYVSVAN